MNNITKKAVKTRIKQINWHRPDNPLHFSENGKGVGIELRPEGKPVQVLDWAATPRALWHWLDGYAFARKELTQPRNKEQRT